MFCCRYTHIHPPGIRRNLGYLGVIVYNFLSNCIDISEFDLPLPCRRHLHGQEAGQAGVAGGGGRGGGGGGGRQGRHDGQDRED